VFQKDHNVLYLRLTFDVLFPKLSNDLNPLILMLGGILSYYYYFHFLKEEGTLA
jgi:hypothetical protein